MIRAWRQKDGSYHVYWDKQVENSAIEIIRKNGGFYKKEIAAFIVDAKTVEDLHAERMVQVVVDPYGEQKTEVYPLVNESMLETGFVDVVDPLTNKKHHVKIKRILGEPFTPKAIGFI